MKTKTADKVVNSRLLTLLDKDLPIEMRRTYLLDTLESDEPDCHETISQLLVSAAASKSDALAEQKKQDYEQRIDELQSGALRPATFVGRIEGSGRGPARVEVRLATGEAAYPIVHDETLLGDLECGDGVLVDAQVRCLLFRDVQRVETGEVARLERRLEGNQVLVTVRDHEQTVMLATAALIRKLLSEEVQNGAQLLVCTRRLMALAALPAVEGLSHYQFLSSDPIPDVVLERDVGDPQPFIGEVLANLEMEMFDPDTAREYKLRRLQTLLLSGVSGSGKTLSTQALIRKVYELMARRTGLTLAELPKRVMRLRSSKILSKWLGDSDKNVDRLWDEAIQLSMDKVVGKDGQEYELPLIVYAEEIDQLSRARGAEGEQIHDRIQAGFLERLDANSQRLGSRLILVIGTTNTPQLLDPAFARRISGMPVHFGRLSRRSFAAVLEKHLDGLPIAAELGADPHQRERRLLRDIDAMFFSSGAHDPGQVELTYVGSSTPVVFHRRDFLTGGLVDRSVQQAALAACRRDRAEKRRIGVTSQLLRTAFDRQVRAMVDQLTPHNVQNHVTLPDGVRVASVRRIPQPKLNLSDLERTSM